jgi:hypothetical protein
MACASTRDTARITASSNIPPPFVINPALDRAAIAAAFASNGRGQTRGVLTPGSAVATARLLATKTPWGTPWKAGSGGPHKLRPRSY